MISQPTRTPNENVTSLGYVASRWRASGGRLACDDSGIRFSSVVGCSGGIGSGSGLWRWGGGGSVVGKVVVLVARSMESQSNTGKKFLPPIRLGEP
jgi:hypothetical protein